MNAILPVLVFLPMLCGPVSYCIGRRSERMRDRFVLTLAVLELLLVLLILPQGAVSFTLPEFCGLGITFEGGGFHAVMAVLTASGWTTATILSREYFAHVDKRNRYYLFWLLTLGATMGVFLSADLFTTFIFFEVMSFTSYVTVVQTDEPSAYRAGETYLAVAVIGGLVTLSGLFLLHHSLGTLEIARLAQAAAAVRDPTLIWVGGSLTLVGFAAKAGAFPLHIWLPTAHPAAPAPASAVLSGVITKTGIYGVAVLSTTLFLHDSRWGGMLALIGAVTMVLGAVLAVCSVDLKRTLACSSVSQIGFILVGLSMQCLLGHHNALAVDGTILHVLNHSLIKMVLFPVAGIIHLSTHSYDLNDIRGFGRDKPLLAVITGIPMLSLAGLPLLNGYVSKTLLHESIVEYIHIAGDQAWLFTALEWLFLLAGGLTFAYMLKLFLCIFVQKPAGELHAHSGRYIAPASAAVLVVYAVVMPLLGVAPNRLMGAVAACARGFFHGEPPAHAVHYFAWVNLKGAVISLCIGALVYVLVVRRLLVREHRYIDPIPGWCNLEFGLYRPLLRWLTRVLLVLATVVDRVVFRLLLRELPTVLGRFWQRVMAHWRHLQRWLTGQEPLLRPSLEHTPYDHHFGRYSDQPQTGRGVRNSFGLGLLLAGLGIVFSILFILLRG